MLGRSCAIQISVRSGPCTPRYGISPATDHCPRTAPVGLLQIGTRSSERPFALLKRLPASGPPFQGRSSWPIPSVQSSNFPEPVRLFRSSTLSSWPRKARIHCGQPVVQFRPSFLDRSSTLHSRSGPFPTLPDQSVKLTTSREAHRIETPDLLRSPLHRCFQ